MLQNIIREKFVFLNASVRGYDSIQDVERRRSYPEVTVDNDDNDRLLYSSLEPKNNAIVNNVNNAEPKTYQLSLPFSILSGFVWASMSIWGVWIAVFYSMAASRGEWHDFNIAFKDMWVNEYPFASYSIAFHLIGAAYMAFVGAFQLVKYVRKVYPHVHRWVGRFYILASMIASVGGLLFIVCKGSFGGREADVAFGAYGLVFLISGIMTYYYAAIGKDFTRHKLWAWRLYSLSLSAWLYRFDYYWWMLLFGYTDTPLGRLDGGWLYNSDMKGVFDYVVNWAFYVPLLLIVEIIFRWGENNSLPTKWQRCLNVVYYVCLVMVVTFSIHQFLQLLVPSVFGGYNWKTQWIL